jgi:hypothetical protein
MTSSENPIACALTAAEMPERLAELRSIGADALLSTRGRTLRFRADDRTRARLEAAVTAESECCAFLRFDLHEENGELALTIGAPSGAEPIADDLVAAFQGGASRPSPRTLRYRRSTRDSSRRGRAGPSR